MTQQKEKSFVVSVHDEKFSPHDIFLNPDVFPRASSGELFEVTWGDRKNKLVVQYFPIAPIKVNIQVSLAKPVAAACNVAARTDVFVEPVSAAAVTVEFVEVSFKDQYIGRSDMWRLRGSLINTCMYTGKKMVFSCMRAQVSGMFRGNAQVSSGFITENTKFIFRSKTAKIYLLIQMSKEMWEFAEDGDLYFEKAVDFLKELFERWAAAGTNHSVAIIFFSRVYFPTTASDSDLNTDQATDRKYRDYYRVICNERRSDWMSALVEIKREFNLYPLAIKWDPSKPTNHNGGDNSTAREGNLLEAVNLSLLVFDRHHIDRDLTRTGQLNVVITPGVGLYDVGSALARITKHKMMENGIGCDLVCLTQPPLHVVPLFRFKDLSYSYAQPHWIHVSYLPQKAGVGFAGGPAPFVPRCRMPEAQQSYTEVMFGDLDAPVMPYEPVEPKGSSTTIVLPRRNASVSQFSSYDQSVFTCIASARSPSKMFPGPRSPRASSGSFQDETSAPKVSSFTDRFRSSSGDALSSLGGSASRGISIEAGRLRKVKSVDPEQESAGSRFQSLEQAACSPTEAVSMEQLLDSYGQSPDRQRMLRANKKASSTPYVKPAFNPFILNQEPKENSTFRKRWVHVFHSGVTSYINKAPYVPNWRSLCEPASLPLTTDYFPTESELKNLYTEGVYSLSLTQSDNVNAYSIEDCLREMMSQRLAQGFQLILGKEEQSTQSRKRIVHYLSFGRVYHKLTIDLSTQNIDIKRYTRRETQQAHKTHPLPYTFCVWPLLQTNKPVVTKRVTIKHQSPDGYPWNYLDRVICGYESQLTEAIRYWRVRFGLIPTSSLLRSHKLFLRQNSSGKEIDDKQVKSPVVVSEIGQETEMGEIDKINNFIKFKSQLLTQGVRSRLAPSTIHKQQDMVIYVESTMSMEALVAGGANLKEVPRPPKPSKLDRTLRLVIDPSKTDRPEFVEIRYDSVYVPGSVYHLELDWIICTGCVVDDFISNMRRKAENANFSLVQLPIDQTSNPFLWHVNVPLRPEFTWLLRDPVFVDAILVRNCMPLWRPYARVCLCISA
eukprot:TRINITY_DN5330_c3_g2_i1.p1 TRINITY_DN5330_c3_g2~~TRINITY_DN5330_c3_g2_i1.p1  ORF type:complete len:1057 (-),score=354.64 TRINITY_DN5330_c3_g2_i1:144-3314(-)